MIRKFALAATVCLAACAAATGSTAQISDPIRFTLEPSRTAGKIQLSFSSDGDGRNHHWSNSVAASELAGLDVAALRGAGQPIRFAIVREPGRIDCNGTARSGQALGECGFTSDPAFANLLASRGYPRPDRDDYYKLALTGVSARLIDALAAARYDRPSLDDLAAMAAVGVTPDYIQELSRRGYRPDSTDKLIEFAALEISPEFIEGFTRIYPRLESDTLVQFRALEITPAFVASLSQLGLGNLSPNDVVELKALNVTPEFVASFRGLGYAKLSADELVQLKALDVTPAFVEDMRRSGFADLTPDRLVQLKAIGADRMKSRAR